MKSMMKIPVGLSHKTRYPNTIMLLKSSVALLVSLATLFSSSAAAAGEALPQLEYVKNIPYVVRCNGIPMHVYNVASSPCAAIHAARAKSSVTIDSVPKFLAVNDPSLNGQWTLEVCGGVWMTPDLNSGTFPCKTWTVKIQAGEVYPPDLVRGWPQTTVFFGQLINDCGSASAAEIAIENLAPEVATANFRLDDCDTPPVNGIQQVFAEAAGDMFTRDRVTMGGVMSTTLFDNRKLNGHPETLQKFGGLYTFKRALAGVAVTSPQ
jgi:hypothetical protein